MICMEFYFTVLIVILRTPSHLKLLLLTIMYFITVSVAAAFLIFIIILLIFFIYFRQKGDYETKEAKGQENADNPDAAIVFCQTGVPDIPKRQEWFM